MHASLTLLGEYRDGNQCPPDPTRLAASKPPNTRVLRRGGCSDAAGRKKCKFQKTHIYVLDVLDVTNLQKYTSTNKLSNACRFRRELRRPPVTLFSSTSEHSPERPPNPIILSSPYYPLCGFCDHDILSTHIRRDAASPPNLPCDSWKAPPLLNPRGGKECTSNPNPTLAIQTTQQINFKTA